MRIAYFSPFNPVRSGISDYSEALVEELSKRSDVHLFVSGYHPEGDLIRGKFEVIDCERVDIDRAMERYDGIVYHMGGTPSHHRYIYERMLRNPGVVVLHDMMYQGFFRDIFLKDGRSDLYLQEMERMYGAPGEGVARRVLSGETVPYEILRKFPMHRRMIDASKGVVVHSRLAEEEVRAVNGDVPVETISHHDFGWSDFTRSGYSPEAARTAARRKANIPPGCLVFASFGFIVPTKRIEVALRAFARLHRENPRSLYCLVGEIKYPIREYIRFLGIEHAVRITGHVPMEGFRDYLDAADVCINLRFPCQGETSGAMLRMLALGKATVVTNHGWFSELPDDACAKVDVDEYEEEILYEFLMAFAEDREYAFQVGENAHGYAVRDCSLPVVARKYIEFVKRCS